MRLRYVQINGQLVPADEYTASQEPAGPYVQGACKPFRSMIDGKEVTSLAKYRAELRARGLQEVGNEINYLMPRPGMAQQGIPDVEPHQRKELIRAQINELGHAGFRRAMQKDIDFIKWNSRGLPK